MTALASPKRKLFSQFLNLSTPATRKAIRADLRQRITDEHPDIARQAAERRGGWGRRKGAGEHDGLVIAVALAGWWGDRLTWGDDMLDRIDEGDDESR